VKQGDFVCIEVRDNGAGIPKSKLARVTDPLYTNKPAGRGSGLGLAMVKRFAAACGGALSIDSVEGKGTSVRIWLPRSDRPAELTANMTLPLSTLAGGDESVMLLIGDRDVRAAVRQILEALGYAVVVGTDWNSAADMATAEEPLSIVVCERNADNQSEARQSFDRMRKQLPDIRQLAILGPDASESVMAPDADACLARPIAVLDLAKAMRRALGDRT
jgi:CheY-like chemotaxis protein